MPKPPTKPKCSPRRALTLAINALALTARRLAPEAHLYEITHHSHFYPSWREYHLHQAAIDYLADLRDD